MNEAFRWNGFVVFETYHTEVSKHALHLNTRYYKPTVLLEDT